MIKLVSRLAHYFAPVKGNRPSIFGTPPKIAPIVTNADLKVEEFPGRKTSRRCGVLAIKQGMTGMWDKWGKRHPLTVLWVDRCQVVQVKTKDSDGYYALQLGAGERSLVKTTKPLVGHFIKANIGPKKKLMECKVSADCLLPMGYQLSASHFVPGQTVDIKGVSKGKGFQGGIKRWGFSRQPASHGNSLTTRAIGSTGQNTDPARVFPGKKMPGNMGNKYSTIQHLKVYKVDHKRDLIYVIGGVPGGHGGVVRITDSCKEKTKMYKKVPHPTRINFELLPDSEIMEPPETDTIESEYIHDNAEPNVKDEPEEGPTTEN